MSDDTPLAAIDIGSNSFRLEIAQIHHGRYRRLHYFKRMVRLGAGLDDQGRLTEAAIDTGLQCLRLMRDALDGIDSAHVRAVATQTLREAANRNAFLALAREALGHPIEVIQGREEARLIYAGASFLSPSAQPRLVIDIGGRSTELIVGRGREPAHAESFAVGSSALSQRFFPGGEVTATAFRDAQVAAGAEFEEALADFPPSRWTEALGCSGTVGAASAILAAEGLTDGRVTPQGLAVLIERLVQAGHVARVSLASLKDERRPVLPGGLATLYTLMFQFGIRELWPSKGALRQGVIVDLHRRLLAAQRGARVHDLRDDTVQALQQRFEVDRPQAERVQQAALALFDALALGDSGEARRELGWVAALHEIGMLLSHHDHHRHASYMLSHVGAPGFSQDQMRQLAALALAQRGGLRKVQELLAREPTRWQVLALRLAVIQCHDRGVSGGRSFSLARSAGSTVRLMLPAADSAAALRMRYLLREEAQAWSKAAALRLELRD